MEELGTEEKNNLRQGWEQVFHRTILQTECCHKTSWVCFQKMGQWTTDIPSKMEEAEMIIGPLSDYPVIHQQFCFNPTEPRI